MESGKAQIKLIYIICFYLLIYIKIALEKSQKACKQEIKAKVRSNCK